ncbi:MAG: tetratricopeptide repeat protein [Chloroflexota bacterium]
MDIELARSANSTRLKRELSRDAIALALKGEWERATEVNKAILELYTDDVDAMNRLGKALMELGRYGEAKEVLDRVVHIAPYNTIAKKNLARVATLEGSPLTAHQLRKCGGVPQLFIEESGKSVTTVLRKTATGQVVAGIAPSDPADLAEEHNAINVYTRAGEYLGQIEPKLGNRLIRLMRGGNRYDAAVIGVNDHGISIIIREAYRHRSLRNVCSFPTRTKEEHRVYLGESFARYLKDDDLEEEDEEEDVIEDGVQENAWSENE